MENYDAMEFSGIWWRYPLVICYSLLLNMAHEKFVDLPIKDGDFPSFFVCLPEGRHHSWHEPNDEK